MKYTTSISRIMLSVFALGLVFSNVAPVSAGSISLSVSPSTGVGGTPQDFEFTFTPTNSIPVGGVIYLNLPRGTTFESGIDKQDADLIVGGVQKTLSDYPAPNGNITIEYRSDIVPPAISFTMPNDVSISGGTTVVLKVGTNATNSPRSGGASNNKRINVTTQGGVGPVTMVTYTSGAASPIDSGSTSFTTTGVFDPAITVTNPVTSSTTDFRITGTIPRSLVSSDVFLVGISTDRFTRSNSLNYTDIDFIVNGSQRSLSSSSGSGVDGISFFSTTDQGYAIEYIIITLGSGITSGQSFELKIGTNAVVAFQGDAQYATSSSAGDYPILFRIMDTNYADYPETELASVTLSASGGASAPEFPAWSIPVLLIGGWWMLGKKSKPVMAKAQK